MKLWRKTILIYPGHGLYWNEKIGAFTFQRDYRNDVLEDILNIETARMVIHKLRKIGYKVLCTRNIDENAEMGESGHSKWEEGAYLHFVDTGDIPKLFRTVSAQGSVGGISDNYYIRDLRARYMYADIVNKKTPINLLLSIHYNAGGGNGTEVWYYKYNKNGEKIATKLAEQTAKLCNLRNRGAKGETKAYAMIKEPDMMSLIWEVAFFSSKTDVVKIQSSNFHNDAAMAAVNTIIWAEENKLI